MTQEGFLLDLHTAELFWRCCRRYNLTTETQRVALMRRIVAKGKAKYLRNPDEYLKGKKILKLKKEPPTNA